MFVRWKKRPVWRGSDHSFDAVVVHSKRDGKRVKQQFIGYVASIRGSCLSVIGSQIAFWEKADFVLEDITLTAIERERIEDQLLRKVPKPDKAEKERYLQQQALEKAAKLAELDSKSEERRQERERKEKERYERRMMKKKLARRRVDDGIVYNE